MMCAHAPAVLCARRSCGAAQTCECHRRGAGVILKPGKGNPPSCLASVAGLAFRTKASPTAFSGACVFTSAALGKQVPSTVFPAPAIN